MTILAIGAHFDDIEIGCGGTLAKHLAQGDRVLACVVTNSKYTDYNGGLMRSAEIALAEGREAARVLGYQLICLDYNCKCVNYGFELIEAINKLVDENKVDTVYTHWDGDVHQDHSAVSLSTIAGARKVHRLLMYQSNLYFSSQPFHANHFSDISDFIDIKMEAIRAHKTEVKKFGQGWLDFWKNEAHNNGKKFGVAYAEAFRAIKYLW
ncbi:MAG: PIG-L family deacetylase [Planctomycetes bacterium]|nr:PIG-L family deacetylase [Planctomycetota bacterium]